MPPNLSRLVIGSTFLLLAAACAPAAETRSAPAAETSSAPARAGRPTEQADLLILGGTVVTMDDGRRVIENGGLAIRDGALVAIDSRAEIEAGWTASEVVEAGSHDLVIPGLINGHGHAAMTLMRGAADDLALMDWLEQYIFPGEAKVVDPDFVRAGTRLAALEMIRSGTTTFVDMYYFADDVAEVVDEVGMRAIVGESLIDFPAPGSPTPADSLAYSRALMERWRDHPRVTPSIAPHAPYTVAPENLLAAAELAREFGMPILIHLAETSDEVDQVEERFGLTPTAHLANIGFLGPDVIGAHAVWLTDDDIEILAAQDVGVVHNPESNLKLASGVMRVGDLFAAGVATGLGTDGPASNNDLDMFGAMLTAPLQQKNVQVDPTATPALQILAMATIEGARALGIADRVGSLEIGKRADVVILDGDAPNLVPRFDPYSHLVYAARGDNVRATIVEGAILFLDGEFRTIDVTATIAAARAQAARVREAVGLPSR
jgi:5-methylthioadenosine/S-adenosylhomocysteine deaminase